MQKYIPLVPNRDTNKKIALIGKELPSQGSIISKVSQIRDGVVKVGFFLNTPTGS